MTVESIMIETVTELLKTVKAERADNEPTLSNWLNLCHESIGGGGGARLFKAIFAVKSGK